MMMMMMKMKTTVRSAPDGSDKQVLDRVKFSCWQYQRWGCMPSVALGCVLAGIAQKMTDRLAGPHGDQRGSSGNDSL